MHLVSALAQRCGNSEPGSRGQAHIGNVTTAMDQSSRNAGSMDLKAIRELLQRQIAPSRCPGIVVTVRTPDAYEVIALGDASTQPRRVMTATCGFSMGCIIKPLVALVTLRLGEEGTLGLDEPLSAYLPELRDDPKAARILLRHLLSHSSGLRGLDMYDPAIYVDYRWASFVNFFRQTDLLFSPGEVLSYEHYGYAVVGEILRRHTGLSIDTLIRDHILLPLGLLEASEQPTSQQVQGFSRVADRAESSAVPVPVCAPFWDPSMSHRSLSMQSLAAIADAIREAMTHSPSALSLGARVVRRLTDSIVQAPRVPAGVFSEMSPTSYGLGCALFGRGLYGHNGGTVGQDCAFRFDPSRGISIAVGMNYFFRVSRCAALINRVAGLLRDVEERGASGESDPPRFRREELVGHYEGPGFLISVREEPPGLICGMRHLATGRSFDIALGVAGDEEFVLPVASNAPIAFFREPGTGVPCLSWALVAYRKMAGAQDFSSS
jgi:CubicO group peptidase (beta-lactamase class C family)